MMQIRIMRSAGVMMRMQWRGGASLSRRRSAQAEKLAATILPFCRTLGYDAWREIAEAEARRVCARWRWRKTAKRKADQPIENKRFREIARFRTQRFQGLAISFRFAWRNFPFVWRNSKLPMDAASLHAKGDVVSRRMIAEEDLEGRAPLPLPRAITIIGNPVEAGASVPGAAM